jgi:hypothetical protein
VGLAHEGAPGRAVQVDPIKPESKAPGTKLLTLIHDGRLSDFAFKLNLRRYSLVKALLPFHFPHADYSVWAGLTLVHFSAQPEPLLTQNTP